MNLLEVINPLEWIYRLFSSIYGGNLAEFLSGYDCAQDDWVNQNLFIPLGLVAIGVALLVFVVYYYIVNSAKLNKWWHWALVMLFVGAINLFIGYEWVSPLHPQIGDCLRYYVTDEGQLDQSIEVITNGSFWLFGLANAIVSSLFFILFSVAFKWWSSNCRRTPF
ncbi:MAG: hypothetical protein IJQ11_00330 [Bacteroidales bacterium]|nr:hypothetical protein [Bacteroidales bacterium]